MKPTRIVLIPARLTLGALFVWASMPKIADPDGLFVRILSYRIGGNTASLVGAVVLPWLELLLGMSLLAGIYTLGAFAVSTGLFITFAAAQGVVLSRGISTECGCGLWGEGDPISLITVARSLLLMGLSVTGYWCGVISSRPAREASSRWILAAMRGSS